MWKKSRRFFLFVLLVLGNLTAEASRAELKIQVVDTEKVFLLCVHLKYSAVGTGMERVLRISCRQVQWRL